jgi:hypothetical protein
MNSETVSRRLSLLAAHGAFILFLEHILWDGAMAGKDVTEPAKHLLGWGMLWLFVGAGAAYGSLVLNSKRGLALEAVSALMLAVPFIWHAVGLTDTIFG